MDHVRVQLFASNGPFAFCDIYVYTFQESTTTRLLPYDLKVIDSNFESSFFTCGDKTVHLPSPVPYQVGSLVHWTNSIFYFLFLNFPRKETFIMVRILYNFF